MLFQIYVCNDIEFEIHYEFCGDGKYLEEICINLRFRWYTSSTQSAEGQAGKESGVQTPARTSEFFEILSA